MVSPIEVGADQEREQDRKCWEYMMWSPSEDEGGSEAGDEVVEEGERPKVGRTPRAPTKEEWDEHMCTHIPFRDWYPQCCFDRWISGHHCTGPVSVLIGSLSIFAEMRLHVGCSLLINEKTE